MKAGGKHTNKIWSIASAKNTKLIVLCVLCLPCVALAK